MWERIEWRSAARPKPSALPEAGAGEAAPVPTTNSLLAARVVTQDVRMRFTISRRRLP